MVLSAKINRMSIGHEAPAKVVERRKFVEKLSQYRYLAQKEASDYVNQRTSAAGNLFEEFSLIPLQTS